MLSVAASAGAACGTATAPCADAEPLWWSPSAAHFELVSDAPPLAPGRLAAGAALQFRLRPAVLSVPSPNADGREVNLLRYATDLTLGLRLGLGKRIELTGVLPAGLYQRGAGIKGVTHQSASEIPAQSLHDPRLGFGYALPLATRWLSAKVRFELKLPLGNTDALAGEGSAVSSPSLAVAAKSERLFAALELGARLRTPTDFFGSRVGSQALIALGFGYALPRPRLSFAAESYLLPSLVRGATTRYLPAEWLLSVRYSPAPWRRVAFGLGGGGALPLSSGPNASRSGFGTPALRALLSLRFTPGPQPP